jgi:hypothetical protein
MHPTDDQGAPSYGGPWDVEERPSPPMDLQDALRDPDAFVEGMTESRQMHRSVPVRPPRLPELGRHIRIWNPRGTTPVLAICTEPLLIGLWTHYYDRRTQLCTRCEGRCSLCKVTARRWKGYVGALNGRTRAPFVLEFTRHAYQTCKGLYEIDGKLERRVLKVWRAHEKPPAPLLCELLPEVYGGYLPDGPYCLPILARVFEVEQLRLAALSVEGELVRLLDPDPKKGVQ